MVENRSELAIPDEVILNKIYLIRDKKVMLDRDLAYLFGIETKALKQTVRRNIKRFPPDFMFEMSIGELHGWRSQIVTSKADKKGLRYPPFCFTEHGVIMLASVLNSDRAIKINVQIVRVFVKMREMMASHKETLNRLLEIERKLAGHDNQILMIYKYLKQFKEVNTGEKVQKKRKRVGFSRKDEQ